MIKVLKIKPINSIQNVHFARYEYPRPEEDRHGDSGHILVGEDEGPKSSVSQHNPSEAAHKGECWQNRFLGISNVSSNIPDSYLNEVDDMPND